MLVFPQSETTMILGTSIGVPIPVIQMSVLFWLYNLYPENFEQSLKDNDEYDGDNDDDDVIDNCEKLHLVLLGEKAQLEEDTELNAANIIENQAVEEFKAGTAAELLTLNKDDDSDSITETSSNGFLSAKDPVESTGTKETDLDVTVPNTVTQSFDTVNSIVEPISETISKIPQVLSQAEDAVESVIERGSDATSHVPEKVLEIINEIKDTVVEEITEVSSRIPQELTYAKDAIESAAEPITKTISNIDEATKSVIEPVSEAISDIPETIIRTAEEVSNVTTEAVSRISSNIPEALTQVKEAVEAAIENKSVAIPDVQEVISQVEKTIEEAIEPASEFVACESKTVADINVEAELPTQNDLDDVVPTTEINASLTDTNESKIELGSETPHSAPESFHSGDTTLVVDHYSDIKDSKHQEVPTELFICEMDVEDDLPSHNEHTLETTLTPVVSKASTPVTPVTALSKSLVLNSNHSIVPKLPRKKSFKKLHALKEAMKLSVKLTKSSSKNLTGDDEHKHKFHLFKKMHAK